MCLYAFILLWLNSFCRCAQEAMMDHSLQMISYIADINNIVVLMARRKPPSPKGSADNGTPSSPSSSSSASASGPIKKCSMVCHVFSSEDVSSLP